MKKVLIISGVVLLLFIVAVITLPLLYKGKIVENVKSSINNQVNAKVTFGDFGLTLISTFPRLTVCLNDLTVTGLQEFEGDTLASIKELEIRLDLMSVIGGGQIKIASVDLDKALVNLLVNKDGKANWDISKPSPAGTTSENSTYSIELKNYSISRSEIRYDDRSAGMKMVLKDVDHSGSGDFTQDLFMLKTTTHAKEASIWYSNINYLNEVETDLKADLEMDMKNSKYTFKENELALNDFTIGFDGFVSMPGEDISLDIQFKTKKTSFGSFVSLIPGIYRNDFKNLKSSGTLSFDGFVKGVYNDKSFPGYGLNLSVENGMFQYPGLPSALNNVQVDLKVNNPDGVTDHTIIDLKQLHLEMGKEPFDARMYVSSPVSDANIDGAAKGKINLGNIQQLVPLEKGTTLSGLLEANVVAKGRVSSIEKKQYEQFNASGRLMLTGMNYTSEDFKQGIAVNRFSLSFNPKNVTLDECDVKTGQTDVKATGYFDNLFGYYLSGQPLKGNLNVNSSLVDLNQLMADDAATAASPDTAAISVIEIPANINMVVNASVKKLLYENVIIQNLVGNVTMLNSILGMNNITFYTLDGSVNMNGSYSTADVKQPAMNLDLTVSNIDIQKTYQTFLTVQKLAPIAERCNGKVSSSFNVAGKLDQHMQPVLNTLSGAGKLKTGNVTITNFEPVSQMADALKMPQYKALNVNDVNLSFEFKDGRVNVKPFETSLAGTKAKIEGSNGFDQTIDYKVDLAIPKEVLGTQAVGAMNNLMASAGKTTGMNFTMPDLINVKVFITGTITKPVIKTGLKDAAMNVAETVKEEVKAIVEEKIDEGKAIAKEQADKLIADAEAKAKQLHDAAVVSADQAKKEGYAAADKLVEKAKDPVSKAAAKVAADKLKKETDAKAAQIIKAADDQGKKLIDEAKKQSDVLLK